MEKNKIIRPGKWQVIVLTKMKASFNIKLGVMRKCPVYQVYGGMINGNYFNVLWYNCFVIFF